MIMDVFYSYTYSTAAWLSLQAIPLIGMPQMIARIMLEEARQPSRKHYRQKKDIQQKSRC